MDFAGAGLGFFRRLGSRVLHVVGEKKPRGARLVAIQLFALAGQWPFTLRHGARLLVRFAVLPLGRLRPECPAARSRHDWRRDSSGMRVRAEF
jgi:hypothetical protein